MSREVVLASYALNCNGPFGEKQQSNSSPNVSFTLFKGGIIQVGCPNISPEGECLLPVRSVDCVHLFPVFESAEHTISESVRKPIVFPENEGSVLVDGNRLAKLTPIQFRVLQILMERSGPGKPTTRDEIIREVFPNHLHPNPRLNKIVGALRRKLDDPRRADSIIGTEWGKGYTIVKGRIEFKKPN